MGANGTVNRYTGEERTEDDTVDSYEGPSLGVFSSCFCPLYIKAVEDANKLADGFNGFLICCPSHPGAKLERQSERRSVCLRAPGLELIDASDNAIRKCGCLAVGARLINDYRNLANPLNCRIGENRLVTLAPRRKIVEGINPSMSEEEVAACELLTDYGAEYFDSHEKVTGSLNQSKSGNPPLPDVLCLRRILCRE